jgi:hypothetical protein
MYLIRQPIVILARNKPILPDPLDATVAEHPTGEAEDSKKDGGQVGDTGFHRAPSIRAVRDKENIQSDITYFQGRRL